MRASPEKKEEKERVRLSLLRATLHVAAAHGFASLGLREVAREAGIAPTSFYRHFADMDELGRALINEFVAPMLSQVEAALKQAADAGEDIPTALINAAFEAAAQDREIVRFLLAEQAGAFTNFRAGLRQKLDGLRQVLESTTQCGSSHAQAAVVILLDELNRWLEIEGADADALRADLRSQSLQHVSTQLKASKGGGS